MPDGWTLYSTHADDFWTLASQVVSGFDNEQDFSVPERKFAALSVLLFAAVTIEAFLNELTYLATGPLRDVLHEIEDSRGSIRLKLLMTTAALGEPIDRGAEPYQSVDLLIQVRDALVHLKPKERSLIDGEGMKPGKLLAELHHRGLIDNPKGPTGDWFLELLATPRICAWALQTARDIVAHVVRLLPNGPRTEFEDDIVPNILRS